MLGPRCRAQGHKYPPWEILQDSQGCRRRDPDHSTIHKGALTDVVAHGDAQAFTGSEPAGVVARSDAQAL